MPQFSVDSALNEADSLLGAPCKVDIAQRSAHNSIAYRSRDLRGFLGLSNLWVHYDRFPIVPPAL